MLGGLTGRIAANAIVTFAPIDLALCQAALTTGDADLAAAHADTAVRASRTRGTPIFLGRELIRLAEARRRLGATHDEISPLVREARDIADRTGATLIHAEAAHYDIRAQTPPPG